MLRRDEIAAIDGVLEETEIWVLEEGEGPEVEEDNVAWRYSDKHLGGSPESTERLTHVDDVKIEADQHRP